MPECSNSHGRMHSLICALRRIAPRSSLVRHTNTKGIDPKVDLHHLDSRVINGSVRPRCTTINYLWVAATIRPRRQRQVRSWAWRCEHNYGISCVDRQNLSITWQGILQVSWALKLRYRTSYLLVKPGLINKDLNEILVSLSRCDWYPDSCSGSTLKYPDNNSSLRNHQVISTFSPWAY